MIKQDNYPQPEKLLYFQNLVPGSHDSPFIQRYKKECLDPHEEQDQQRKKLLNEFPPVLSFTEKQKKKFYEDEAKSCHQFCCGSMDLSQDYSYLKPQDNYMFSMGSGKLYEGSANNIKEQMSTEIKQEAFGSPKQEQGLAGLKQLELSVAQRNEASSKPGESIQENENKTYNPFKTTLQPPKD